MSIDMGSGFISPEDFYSKYIAALQNREIPLNWNERFKKWTKENLKYFKAWGRESGYEVWPDRESPDHPEFLVDLCWEDKSTEFLSLVLEQEWHDRYGIDEDCGRWWDFTKLVYLKARLKVFIFYIKKGERDIWDEAMKEWAKWITSYKIIEQPKEEYLIIAFSRSPNRKNPGLYLEGFAIKVDGNINFLGKPEFIPDPTKD